MLSETDRDWCLASNVLSSTSRIYAAARNLYTKITSGPNKVVKSPYQGFSILGQPLDGLTSTLDHLFHPVPLDISTGGLSTGGSQRGVRVDTELANLIQPKHNSNFSHTTPVHDYTYRIVRRLRELQLRPFMAQAPVGSVPLRLATALDLLCVDESRGGALVNVQIKTGFERRENYKRSQPGAYFTNMGEKPVADSFEMRHLLQVIVEHLIVQTAYDTPLAYSLLMVVSLQLITTESVPSPNPKIDPVMVARAIENRLRPDAPPPVEAEVEAVRKRYAAKRLRKVIKAQRKHGRKYSRSSIDRK